jgi:hypothetical protein
LQAAGALVVVGGEVNVMASLGEAAQHGFEIAEVSKVASEEQDLHWAFSLSTQGQRANVKGQRF